MSEKIFLHIDGLEPIECVPFETEDRQQSDADPFSYMLAGKPLLNPDGSVFFTSNEKLHEIYERGERLVVFVGKWTKKNEQ